MTTTNRSKTATGASRRTIASYSTYADAERAVDWLADHGFAVERSAIVGTGLRSVEQVTGRMTPGRAAGIGAAQGALIGALFALLFGIFFTGPDFVGLLLYALALGALFGALGARAKSDPPGCRCGFRSPRAATGGRQLLCLFPGVRDALPCRIPHPCGLKRSWIGRQARDLRRGESVLRETEATRSPSSPRSLRGLNPSSTVIWARATVRAAPGVLLDTTVPPSWSTGPARPGPDGPGHRTRRVRFWPGRRVRAGARSRPPERNRNLVVVSHPVRTVLESLGVRAQSRAQRFGPRSRRRELVSPAVVESPGGLRMALGDVDELERLVRHLDCGRQAGGLRDQLA
jgi:hypothetical protein